MKKLTSEKAYQTTFRRRHIFAKELDLTDREYRIWDLYTTVYDWDSRHTETFGTIETTDAQVASLIGCDPSTVNRTKKLLIQKGLIKQLEDGLIQILVVAEKPNATHQHAYAPHQYGYAPQNNYLAGTQQNQGYSQESPLVASKEDLGSSKANQSINTNAYPTINTDNPDSNPEISHTDVFGRSEKENSPNQQELINLKQKQESLKKLLTGRWNSPNPSIQEIVKKYTKLTEEIQTLEKGLEYVDLDNVPF